MKISFPIFQNKIKLILYTVEYVKNYFKIKELVNIYKIV